MQQQKSERLCKYFQKGRCKFKDNCRFSHKIVECFLIRHAQSEFNLKMQMSEHETYSENAKKQYHLDTKLIDCGITDKGINQIANIVFPEYIKINGLIKVDAIFVSPLERALITADFMQKFHKMTFKKIIVLSNLTQVLSKICDFSAPSQPKMDKYKKFNFQYFRQAIKGKEQNWQDDLVSQHYLQLIDKSKIFGERYVKALQQVFPQPLETSGICYARSMKVIAQIKNICIKQNYNKIIIISHNRILKYISGREEGGKVSGLANCQVRTTKI